MQISFQIVFYTNLLLHADVFVFIVWIHLYFTGIVLLFHNGDSNETLLKQLDLI